MKKLLLFGTFVVCLFHQEAGAQIRLNLNVNIGAQPAWGPVGYDHVEYYYLPDVDAYYNVDQQRFVYLEGGRWVFGAALPPRFGRVDLYSSYKVVVNEQKPYLRADYYRKNYGKYKNWHGERQPIIRESHEEKYRPNRERDQHRDQHDEKGRDDKGHGHDDKGHERN